MVATVDFLPFATGVDANVLDQADYLAASFVAEGFQSGIATSDYLNKVWRQSSFIAAGLANYVANQTGDNVLDDGNLANFIANLTSAIAIGASVKPSRTLTTSVATPILLTDYRVGWNRTAGPAALTATLPAGAAVGQSFKLGDIKGNMNQYPITVAPQAGQTIANLPGNFVMNVDRAWWEFCYMGGNTWSLEQ
jgi:hypothetical protein